MSASSPSGTVPCSTPAMPVASGCTLLPFTKMHGLGNDFVMMTHEAIPPHADLAKLTAWLCHRQFGVGADGLIVVSPATEPGCDIRFVYYNSDGSIAEMCGNGIRCFARFVVDRGILPQRTFQVQSLAGVMVPVVHQDGQVTVDMGEPILSPSQVPFMAEVVSGQWACNVPLHVLDQMVPVSAVSMGNPHCLVFQQDLAAPLDPAVYGPALEVHPAFPNKTNVEFLEVMDRRNIKATVWERGCGFTLACGTGACASAVAAMLHQKVDAEVVVHLPGGPLSIVWRRDGDNHVLMTGPADYVFEGQVQVPSQLLSPSC